MTSDEKLKARAAREDAPIPADFDSRMDALLDTLPAGVQPAKKRRAPRLAVCIGIAAAHMVKDAHVAAVDNSEGALRVTRENARRLGVQSRFVAVNADVRFRPPGNMGQFDIIVSNPPYVTRSEMHQLDKSVYDYEPHEALYGGVDGLDFYRSICSKWGSLLVTGGIILFECGWQQATDVAAILEKNRFGGIGITEDLAGVPRIVYGYNTEIHDPLE